ncbi:MAG TPA: YlxR family protein [Candidatus Limnocylindria bacterium]
MSSRRSRRSRWRPTRTSWRTRTAPCWAARRRRIVVRAVPQRTCVACRQVKAKRELIRVVRDADGRLSVDLRGKAPGRGAYLDPDDACLERGIDEGSLGRALELTIDDATKLRLRDELAAGAEKRRT